MQPVPASVAASSTRAAAADWRRGLIAVLTGPGPAPGWRWRSPAHRRAAFWTLALITVALIVVTLSHAPDSQLGFQRLLRFRTGIRQVTGYAGAGPAMLFGLAGLLPLPLVIRNPMLAWRLAWLAFLLVPLQDFYWWGGWPWYPAQAPVMLAIFCAAGLWQPRIPLCWMSGLTLLAWWLWSGPHNPDLVAHLLGTAAFVAVTLAVDSLSSRRRAQQALSALTEQTQESQVQLTVLAERARIARELHDVVAHHMSLIAVRAESAPYRLTGLPEPVQAEFLALSGAAREALTDMRRLLGVLRHDESAERAPQPGLADLPELVAAARRAGVPVELSAAGILTAVPAGVAVCAYRIVQESLSNAGRHAPGAAVRVTVGHDDAAITLRVTSGPSVQSGSPPAAPEPAGGPRPGHGLAGMRERVSLLGGSLSAGPAPDGGFVVSAVLPFGAAA